MTEQEQAFLEGEQCNHDEGRHYDDWGDYFCSNCGAQMSHELYDDELDIN